MSKSREELLLEMQQNIAKSGNVYMNEVATPGCRPDSVKEDEVKKDD